MFLLSFLYLLIYLVASFVIMFLVGVPVYIVCKDKEMTELATKVIVYPVVYCVIGYALAVWNPLSIVIQ